MGILMEAPWWNQEYHSSRRSILLTRNFIIGKIRDWFQNHNFIEVETSCMQKTPCMEQHLHALKIQSDFRCGKDAASWYLHTSPEFSCKKLLAAGEKNIFTICKSWRDDLRSSKHSPEFTMLEWYRSGASYKQVMEDCKSIIQHVSFALAEDNPIKDNGILLNLQEDWGRITVNEAFKKYASLDLCDFIDIPDSLGLFADAARQLGIGVSLEDKWDDIFSKIIMDLIEPFMGIDKPMFLLDYPVSEAVFSKVKDDNHLFAERFELYINSYEIANGSSELVDFKEQKKRFVLEQKLKNERYGFCYSLDEDLLSALSFITDGISGVAMGLDRLVMILTGAKDIRTVMWDPSCYDFGL